jgi:aspartyl-tRNA(Asn)/glutamyl-tRNA(Gln) amidotransferase subunit A
VDKLAFEISVGKHKINEIVRRVNRLADIWRLSLEEQSKAIAHKLLSPKDLLEAALARIDALDERLDTTVTVMAESAFEAADAATKTQQSGVSTGLLHGLPIGLKDIFDTAGVLTAGGSKTQESRIPNRDATSVTKLKEAGAVIAAKLTTHEFAHGGPSFDLPWPPARNPWNRDHFTGGSSSGSGAAVAAGIVAGAMGSDTGGSIRGPATYCGVAGLKPTYGLVSRAGVIPNSFTFDHCGPLAWTARDCALLLDALAGPDSADPASAGAPPPNAFVQLGGSLKGLKVGVLRHFWEEDVTVSPEMIAVVENAAAVLADLGADVAEARIAPVQDYYDVKIVIAESELFNVHRQDLLIKPHDFGTDFLARSLGALLFTGQDYVAAQRRRRQLIHDMQPIYEQFDVFLAPAATGPAPRLDAHNTINFWRYPNVLTPFNVTSGPALSVNGGFSGSGLPLGVQLVGRPFDDARILNVGAALEASLDLKSMRPDVEPGPAPTEASPKLPAPVVDISAEDGARIVAIAAAAGFKLDERLFALLGEGAPYAWAMGERLQKNFGYGDEPMNIYQHVR